jgi:hypothetical protein
VKTSVTILSDTVYKGTVPQHLVYIVLPMHQTVNPCVGWGERIQMVNIIHLAGPAGSYTSQPNFISGYKVSDKTGYFDTIIL